ncbi:alpha-E domain-containing protein [Streptomyces sp. NPDC057690]|uniref:alpha-E domain-containing protein n=1 Tax=Streptomyces sp. NPDC057690 TaxID=3346214 RepID=UPI00369BD5B5
MRSRTCRSGLLGDAGATERHLARRPTGRRAAPVRGSYGHPELVPSRAALVSGLADSTTSRDDSRRSVVLGRSPERVDMTVRPSSVRVLDAARAHGGFGDTPRVAGSLPLERDFPRGALHAGTTAHLIHPGGVSGGPGGWVGAGRCKPVRCGPSGTAPGGRWARPESVARIRAGRGPGRRPCTWRCRSRRPCRCRRRRWST